jgi:excisionase family DNA binding protein
MAKCIRLTNEQLTAILSAPPETSSANLAHEFGCTTRTIDTYRSGGWFSPIVILPCRDCGEPVIAHTKTKLCRKCKQKAANDRARQRYLEHPPVSTELTRERARQRTRQWSAEHHKPRPEPPGLLTTTQVAKKLGISPGRVTARVASGQLHAKLKTPNRIYFEPVEVERYAEVRQANAESRYGPNTPGLLTRKQVQERLGLSRWRVNQLIDEGRLVPVEPNGRYLRIDEAQVERFAAVTRRRGKTPRGWTEAEDHAIVRDPQRSARLIALELGRSRTAVSQRRLALRSRQNDATEPPPEHRTTASV